MKKFKRRIELLEYRIFWRREWDSNPRSLSGQRFSRPSDSAALAPLRARSGKDVQLTVDGFEIQMKSYA